MMTNMTTGFIARLRDNDEAAWFELWENFAPVLRSQLSRWGRGRIGQETVQDLSQETMAALASKTFGSALSDRPARFFRCAWGDLKSAGESDRKEVETPQKHALSDALTTICSPRRG